MIRINVNSVQQYTLDRLRVSLSSSYETELLEKLSFKFLKEGVDDVSDRLKDIAESNAFDWEYLEMTDHFDLYLKENTCLEEGKYTFILYRNGEEMDKWSILIGHMEDVRVEIDQIRFIDLETIHVSLKPITRYYQSITAMKILSFSLIDEAGNHRSDDFQPLSEAIDGEIANGATEIKEFTLKLRPGKAIPMDYYDVRLTSLYKSRTFPIIEKLGVRMPFMTTTPPKITSVSVTTQSVTKQTVLSVVFNPFIMKGLILVDGADLERHDHREIIRHGKNGGSRDISAFFDSTRGSTKSYSIGDIPYVTRFEIPLVENSYSLEKGSYTIRWWWDDDWYDGIYKPIEFTFDVGWIVNKLDGLEVFEGRFVDFDLPSTQNSDNFLKKYNLLVELNGEEIVTSDIFGPLEEVAYMKTGIQATRSDHFGVRLLDIDKIQDGTYTFLLWTVRDYDLNGFEGDIYYNYLGNIDIVDELTPTIKEVYQSSVDTLTVVLDKALPINALSRCELVIRDTYGRIDFSDRLMSIEQSNVWELGQIMADRFDVIIKNDKTLSSGQYQFKAVFKGKDSNIINAYINHVEARRGMIESIEQIALNKIRITFTETQSRQFLLSTRFQVYHKLNDGTAKYYQDRFELLENVLKADQMSFKSIDIMMDKYDSFPAGRYEIGFFYDQGEGLREIPIYTFDVELGYMTNNIPEIRYVNMEYDDAGDLILFIDIKNEMEQELYEKAVFFCIRQTDGLDIESDFEEKEMWQVVERASKQDIMHVMNIRIPARPVEYAHIERGVYTVGFTWEGIIKYMEDVSKQTIFPWNLPKIVRVEVVDMNMDTHTARMYFEMSTTMQYSYLENLKVEVIDPEDRDATSVFDSVYNSNHINPSLPDKDKLSSNSFNLDILDTRLLVNGVYQFIFYTEIGGTRQSDWIATYDMKSGIFPKLANVYQSSMTTITIELKEPISRRLLEELGISFRSFDKTDYSDQFLSISASNSDSWSETVREVTTFQYQLASNGKVPKGSYMLYLYNHNTRCDFWALDIECMEAGYGALSYFRPTSLSNIEMHFKQLEPSALFKGLTLVIETEPPYTEDYSDRVSPVDALEALEADYFDTLNIKVTKPIPDGMYSVRWEQRLKNGYVDGLPDNMDIHIPFVSNTYPYIDAITITKLGEIMEGDDALIISFFPPLEMTLYEDSIFSIVKTLHPDIEVTDRFKNIKEYGQITTTFDQYGIEYVETITLEFACMETLNRDQYTFRFEWYKGKSMDDDDPRAIHNYMGDLAQEQLIDHILFPLLKVEQIDMETVRLYFKNPKTPEEMRRSEVYIDTAKTIMTADGPERVIVDFTYNFLSMQKTNEFVDGVMVTSIDVKLGQRDPNETDPNKQAKDFIPPDTYRFMVFQYPEKEDYGLIYKYVGSGYIDFLMNLESLYSEFELRQTSYDKLNYLWKMLQYTELLNIMKFSINRPDPQKEGDILDYSYLFQTMKMSNYYNRATEDGYESGYYEEAEDYPVSYDEVVYTLHATPTADVKLKNGSALPAHTYNTSLIYKEKEYFKKEMTLPFMTSNPPEVDYMYVFSDEETDQSWLVVRFSPLAEIVSLNASTFHMMTYRGEYADGSIKGDDKTHYFGQISESEVFELETEEENPEIRYVTEIHIPIIEGAILPSGRYRLTWTWPEYSFFPQSIYIGGLSPLGIGLDYARVIAADTIEVVLLQEVTAKDFKEMALSVRGYHDGDVTARFMDLKKSNESILDSTRTKTFYLKLLEGEEIGGDTYRFVISQLIEEDDENDEVNYIQIETIIWEMTIVYMASSFPNMDALDNLSLQKFVITTLSNYGIYQYLGRDVLLVSSNDPNEIETLTEVNKADYIDKLIRVYGEAEIDKLTGLIDEEVGADLIYALEMEIYDSEGADVTDSYLTPGESNKIMTRTVLHGLYFTLNKYDTVENVLRYDFYVETASGKDISGYFKEVEYSNAFTSEKSKIKNFSLFVDDSRVVESHDTEGLIVRMRDASAKVITKFTYNKQYRTIDTVSKFDLSLAPETTMCPGRFTFKFKYTNDPDTEEPVYLYPFTYTGNMPFLSNNLGMISAVTVVDMEHIDLTFSELSLPVQGFNSFELRFVDDEENILPPDTFEPLSASNIFGGAETLEELEEPGVIHIQLNEGKTIPAGQYRIQFWIDVAANEFGGANDEEESDDEEDDDIEKDLIRTGEYCLWDKYTSLPLMFREMSNSIKSVEIIDINRLKVTLEKETDISYLRSFTVDLYDELKDVTYTNKFESMEKSNFFGMYVMATDKSNIMYSTDGSYWNSFSTGHEYSYTKCFYHEPTKYYYALTTNGKIIRFTTAMITGDSKASVEVMHYADKLVRSSLNDFALINNETLVIVGNSGTILRGKIDSYSGEISLTNMNEDKSITSNTLSAIAYADGVLIAVGFKGTILKSTDLGLNWVSIPSGIITHLYDVTYHHSIIEVEGELPELGGTDDDDPTLEDELPESSVEETIESSGFYACGAKGVILVCDDFEEGFTKLSSGVQKTLFSICSHEDTIISVGDTGCVVTINESEDGLDVHGYDVYGCNFALRDVAFCNGKYFACGSNGSWLSSKDGDKWTINSCFSSGALKSITYIPSQYKSTSANWFYLKVRQGQEITPINFYSGWDEPTLESDFCVDWESDKDRDYHLGDLYTQFEFKDLRAKPKEFYHFKKTATFVPIDDYEDDVENRKYEMEDVEYKWVKCSGTDVPHHGSYYVRLRVVNKEKEQWVYGTEKPVDLPYMTGTDLKITAVELHSPDDEPSVEFYKPYLWIKTENVTENCFHYVRYEFMRSDMNWESKNNYTVENFTASAELVNKWASSPDAAEGDKLLETSTNKVYKLVKPESFDPNNPLYIWTYVGMEECTNWFQSVRVGEYTYENSLKMNGIILFGNPDLKLTDIRKGLYRLKWTWMAPGTAPDDEKYFSITDIPVKNMLPFIDTMERDSNKADTVHVTFTKAIDQNFFEDGFDLGIRRVPTCREELEDGVGYNYYSAFTPIDQVEGFGSEYEIGLSPSGNTIHKIKTVDLVLTDNYDLNSGRYQVKFNNDNAAMKYIKEDDDNIWVTCDDESGLDLEDEMTGNLPVITDVTLERYTPIPSRLDGKQPETHTGDSLADAVTLMQLWQDEGSLENHYADRFTDKEGTVYYLKKESPSAEAHAGSSGYVWWKPNEEPYLCIAFDPMPQYSTFVTKYKEWLLNEMEDLPETENGEIPQKSLKDLRPYFRQRLEYFEFDTMVVSNGFGGTKTCISRLYIPFVPDFQEFPGCENGTFVLKFDDKCIYKTLEYRHAVLPRCYKRYGNIASITPKNPSVRKNDPTAGFIVKFQKILSKEFVRSMELTVTRILSASEKEKLNVKSNEIDVTDRFESLYNSNEADFDDYTIDELQQINVWLKEPNFIDHGKYRITLVAEVEEDTIFEIEDASPVKMSKTVTCPWLSTDIPTDMTAKLTISGTSNPVLTITFTDVKPPRSSIIKSKTNNSANGKVLVCNHKNPKKTYHTSFRPLANSTVKFTYDKNLAAARTDSVERWVTSIAIPMTNNSALPKGTFDVTFRFHPKALLEDIPYPAKYGYTQFTTTQVIITRVGAIDTFTTLDSRRCKVTIKKNAAINTNAKLAKSRVGQVLNVKTWKALLGKLAFRMTIKNNKRFYQGRFYKGKQYVKISNNAVQFKIKPNYLINAWVYRIYFVKGKCTPIAPRHREFKGLIWNKIGKAANDPRIWILIETEPDGKTNRRVYRDYKMFLNRKKKIRALNTLRKFKYKLCKKCRRIKLLSTNKISGCINTYDIPYQYTDGIAMFFKELVKKWYKMRANTVKISTPKGKKLTKKGLVKTKDPNKIRTYKCSTAPFSGFKFEKRAEGKGEERQVSFGCANYVSSSKSWDIESRIATVHPNHVPKDRSKIYLAMLVYRAPGMDVDFHFKRGYKSTKNGKKTSAFKKYKKSLQKIVDTKKKNAQRCSRCKKKEIAEKKNKTIGWGAARFPVQVMSKKNMKTIPKYLNVSEKKGGFKCKKTNKKGCKKPKFIWAKVTVKKKAYAKLKCSNMKTFPKTLYVGNGYQGIYYAARGIVGTSLQPTMLTDDALKELTSSGHTTTKKKKTSKTPPKTTKKK